MTMDDEEDIDILDEVESTETKELRSFYRGYSQSIVDLLFEASAKSTRNGNDLRSQASAALKRNSIDFDKLLWAWNVRSTWQAVNDHQVLNKLIFLLPVDHQVRMTQEVDLSDVVNHDPEVDLIPVIKEVEETLCHPSDVVHSMDTLRDRHRSGEVTWAYSERYIKEALGNQKLDALLVIGAATGKDGARSRPMKDLQAINALKNRDRIPIKEHKMELIDQKPQDPEDWDSDDDLWSRETIRHRGLDMETGQWL